MKINRIGGTDFHMHISRPGEVYDDVQFTGDRALLAADSIDLERAVVISKSYSINSTEADAIRENDFVLSEAKKHSPRVAAACAVNPSRDWAEKESARCAGNGGKILKLHLMASGLDLKKNRDYEKVYSFISSISKLNFTILLHANYPKAYRGDEISKVVQLINAFPKVKWIIGHSFGREHSELSAIGHRNFFVEISIVPFWCKTDEERKLYVETIRKVGVEKFIFGSDWPVLHPAEMKKAFEKLPLTDAEKDMILRSNGTKLDGLFL